MGNPISKKLREKPFNPEGREYDDVTAQRFGLHEPGEHGYSRVPNDPEIPALFHGLQLKGRKHPTFARAVRDDEKLGYAFRRASDGRYYSQPRLEPTGEYMPWGRQLYNNQATGGQSTELTQTFPVNEERTEFVAWPSIFNGRVLSGNEPREEYYKRNGVDPEIYGNQPAPRFPSERAARANAGIKFQR